jgi:predicted PurR-regulated permease PerM
MNSERDKTLTYKPYLFGFTGLFLAVPLLIVGYIWFREVVIRDILDDWKKDENYSRNQ